MDNSTTFQLKARAMLCTSLAVLLTACGGGSGTDTSQTELLKSASANQNSNGYVNTDTSSTTTTAPTTTTSLSTSTDTTAPSTDTTAPTTTTSTAPTTTAATTYNYYVATTGSDSNPGTQSAPFRTILRASQVAKPDTTIHVAPGTYTGNFTTASNGTASGLIRYVSDVKQGAKIVGTGTEVAWTNKGNYIEVNGFDISTSGRLGFYSAGSFGRIYNCLVHDIMVSGGISGSGGAGIDVLGSNWVIHDNIVRNVDAALTTDHRVQGIYIAGADANVYNNLILNVVGQGINSWHGATRAIIVNNTISNAGIGILIGSGDSGQLPNGSQNNYVANNILVNNRRAGIVEGGKTSLNTYVNNLFYNNPRNTEFIGSGNVVSDMITANPSFVNYQANGTGDYRVQATSPAIDKGTSTRAPSTDLAGTARPRGAGIDIGAYEY